MSLMYISKIKTTYSSLQSVRLDVLSIRYTNDYKNKLYLIFFNLIYLEFDPLISYISEFDPEEALINFTKHTGKQQYQQHHRPGNLILDRA